MARDFKITDPENKEWLFLDKFAKSDGYISYMHVIERGLFYWLHYKEGDVSRGKEILRNIMNDYDSQTNIQNKDIEIDIYFLKDSDAAVIVDHSKWCFPLVCYSEPRKGGLYKAIHNLHDKSDGIMTVLSEHTDDWNSVLQDKLDKFDNRYKMG